MTNTVTTIFQCKACGYRFGHNPFEWTVLFKGKAPEKYYFCSTACVHDFESKLLEEAKQKQMPQKPITLKEAILLTVNSQQGIKGVELVLNVMAIINPMKFKEKDYIFELAELVSVGEIVEMEYILPQMDYRIKSIYFPKGTKFHVDSNDKAPKNSDNAQSSGIRPVKRAFRFWLDLLSFKR